MSDTREGHHFSSEAACVVRTIDSGSTPSAVPAPKGQQWTGSVVEVWRTSDQLRVCALSLARAPGDTTPADTSRFPFCLFRKGMECEKIME